MIVLSMRDTINFMQCSIPGLTPNPVPFRVPFFAGMSTVFYVSGEKPGQYKNNEEKGLSSAGGRGKSALLLLQASDF